MERRRTGFESWEKSPGNPVSDVDLAIDRLLRERLSALAPAAGWLSEESADHPERRSCDSIWIVDPIDGTRDYIRGRPGWCVSIALVESGEPVIAVLDAPARGEVWRAARGKGATRNGRPLKAGNCSSLPGARVPSDGLPRIDRDLTMVAKPNSIALRIAMVAADEADIVATRRWGSEWDVAAAVLIAREAGATVTDAFGQPLTFNKTDPRAFGVLATAPGIHVAAMDRLHARIAASTA